MGLPIKKEIERSEDRYENEGIGYLLVSIYIYKHSVFSFRYSSSFICFVNFLCVCVFFFFFAFFSILGTFYLCPSFDLGVWIWRL